MPIVIDVLNFDSSMKHHFSAYGFWAPAIGDYIRHRIMLRMNDPRYLELGKLVDPYAYREVISTIEMLVPQERSRQRISRRDKSDVKSISIGVPRPTR